MRIPSATRTGPSAKAKRTPVVALASEQCDAMVNKACVTLDPKLVRLARLLGQEAARQAWRNRHCGYGLIETAMMVALAAAALAIFLSELS